MNRNLVNVAIVCLALCGLVTRLDALQCRAGFQNKAGHRYVRGVCRPSEPACFQAVKCYKVGEIALKDYTWACIDRSKCSNSKGKSVATHMGVKGRSQIFQLGRVALIM